MHIAIFGATGGTGREVMRQAMAAGHEVTAFVRRQPTDFPAEQQGLRIVIGNVDDQETVDRAAVRTW
jgi:uncharacterized protein YbjT (DUF2867 family)